MNEKEVIDQSTKTPIRLGSAIMSFARSLAALREFVEVIHPLLDAHYREFIQQHRLELLPLALGMNAALESPFLSEEEVLGLTKELKYELKLTKSEGKVTFAIPPEFERQTVTAMKGAFKNITHNALLYRSALISLVSSAEWLLSQIIRQHLELYPDAVGTRDKALSLEDLKTFGSIEDATQHLISQRIDEIMRGSFEDWIKYLQEKMKLSLGYLAPHKEKLVEVFQRRNVTVHNNGLANSTYIAKVVPALRQGISIGYEIPIPQEYLNEAIDLVESLFILFAAELWKQLDPKDVSRGRMLIDIAFDRLQEERWSVAEALSLFLTKDKQLPDRDQTTGQLNYWQCLKWQGRFEEVVDNVKSADFSAKDELYQLARHGLLDQAADFITLLPKVIKAGKLDRDKLMSWPIFKEIRKTEEFAKFIESYGKELNLAVEQLQKAPNADADTRVGADPGNAIVQPPIN